MNDIVPLLKERIQQLSQLPKGQSDRTWTKELKDKLGALGKELEWRVCTAGDPGRFDCEWLYDLVWYREENGHLNQIGLVLESEWSPSSASIKYDFEKLLVAKSPFKVMIFQGWGDEDLSTKIQLLEKSIMMFHTLTADEVYLLAAFDNAKYQFRFAELTAQQSVAADRRENAALAER